MNLIPKINGRMVPHKGRLTVHEPLSYSGELYSDTYAMRFGLLPASEGMLFLNTDPDLPEEGYRLIISSSGIELTSSAQAGQFYGLITLESLLRENRGGLLELDSKIPYMEIEDHPRFSHRGFMLDVSRHFTGVTEIERLLEQMALLKLNKFHWHLSDDQGFRVESRRFPELNEIGSVLAKGQSTDGSTRGFYTQDEIREIIAFAADRAIEVIPEIDLPGHTTAIVAAYPELSCDEKEVKLSYAFTDERRILCAGEPKVYEFLYELLDEVCSLFPGKYFHLGGDEVPKEAWKACPKCQQMIREKDLGDEEGLQAFFTKQLIDHLLALGKTAIGWNEILKSGTLPTDGAVVQFWSEELIRPTDQPYVMNEMPKGYPFIFSSNPAFYFDYPYALVKFRSTYEYEPNVAKDYSVPKEQVLGVEAALWTEGVKSVEILQQRIFPRLLALSENAWTEDRKDYDDFLKRVKEYLKVLKDYGIQFTPLNALEPTIDETVRQVLSMLEAFQPDGGKNKRKSMPAEMLPLLFQIGRFVLSNAMMYSYNNDEKEEIIQKVKAALLKQVGKI
ncbi:MAG: beta-N-acetylhexosaminidase [Firmicutes bacterium]|nr:beta-N-acetylhexosaminidase [Bacillota bacterium]